MAPHYPAAAPRRRAVVASTTLSLTLALVGCLPQPKADVRKPEKDPAVTPTSLTEATAVGPDAGPGSDAGQYLSARRTRLSIAILGRPANDPVVNEAVWGSTDEGILPAEDRADLAANGLRVGLVRGTLPLEVESALNPPPPAKKVEVVEVDQPDGEATTVDLGVSEPSVTLLLSKGGRAAGKDYRDAKGLLRLTAAREDSGPIRLKLVPEIRHGPSKRGYAASSSGEFQPKEFVLKDGQAEETFRDLATTVRLQAGQILVVGATGGSPRGLGGFLFHRHEADNDRLEQRVVLIWARPGTAVVRPEVVKKSYGFRRFRAPDAESAPKAEAKADPK